MNNSELVSKGRVAGTVLAVFVMLFFSAAVATAQEHPSEHPQEHPSSNAEVTKETLAMAITDYVDKESNLKGGYFMVFDNVAKEPLALTLDKVHKEKLASLGNGVYFACADFKATNGNLYDLDIFMQEGHDGLVVSDISVHKVEGNPRYTWIEKDGIWKKKEL